MTWLAFKMLTGDRSKFLGIVFGVMFASLLIAHQVSIFISLLQRTTSQIRDVREPDLWVMDAKVRYVEEVPALRPTDLQRVRSVPGVAWAVPLHKSNARARLSDGNFRQILLMGIDDDTLVGAPRRWCWATSPTCASPTQLSSMRRAIPICGRTSRWSWARCWR